MSIALYTKIRPFTFSFAALLVFSMSSFTDSADDISVLIKAGNAKEIAKLMASSVELTVLSDENVYSKVQAEAILKDFFAKHQPSSVKLIHKINSKPGYRFTVLLLTTSNGAFRFSFGMKGAEGAAQISEIRIEPNKE